MTDPALLSRVRSLAAAGYGWEDIEVILKREGVTLQRGSTRSTVKAVVNGLAEKRDGSSGAGGKR